jgi:capsular exopolysaccharide synthesis family protein
MSPIVDAFTRTAVAENDLLRVSGDPVAVAGAPVERPQLSWPFSDAAAEKLVVARGIDPVTREQYRKLAGVLHRSALERDQKVIMVTSAVAGEGKTLTAVNLALTLSNSYEREVLLIDGDLRNPTIREIFDIPVPLDLHRRGAAPVSDVIRVRPRLSLRVAHHAQSDPIGTLTSPEIRQMIEAARATYDWVLIDTPPIGLLPDGNLLANLVDGVVLVVSAGTTSYEIVKKAADAVGRERLLGVVLNRADARNLPNIGHYANYLKRATVD